MRDYAFLIFFIILGVLAVIFLGINIFWVIYAFVKYGGKPISEIPAWAIFYMFK